VRRGRQNGRGQPDLQYREDDDPMNLARTPKALALCAALPALVSAGGALTAPRPAYQGPVPLAPPSWGVVITELMKDPAAVSDTQGEWFEIYNPVPWRLNIEGWSIGDDSGPQHVISNGGAGVYLRPGQYFVLGRNADPVANGGVQVDYAYTSFSMSNGADQVVLRRRNGLIADRVAYDDGVLWPDQAGQSISLDPSVLDAQANDDGANWCSSTSVIPGSTDTGTPGAPNDPCP
jgi:Lamin Tail Domain